MSQLRGPGSSARPPERSVAVPRCAATPSLPTGRASVVPTPSEFRTAHPGRDLDVGYQRSFSAQPVDRPWMAGLTYRSSL